MDRKFTINHTIILNDRYSVNCVDYERMNDEIIRAQLANGKIVELNTNAIIKIIDN